MRANSAIRAAIVTAAFVFAASLVGCGTSTGSEQQDAATQQEAVSSGEELDSQQEADASSNQDEDSSSSSPELEELPSQRGSIALDIDPVNDNPIVSEQTARDIFTITLEGNTYELPCPVQELLDDGWEASESFLSKEEEYEPNTGLGNIHLHYKGNEDLDIRIDTMNLTDKKCKWSESTLTGVTAETNVDFRSKAGFGLDTSMSDMLDIVGTNTSHYLTKYMHSCKVQVRMGQPDNNSLIGWIEYYTEPNEENLTELGIKLSTTAYNPLLV